MQRVPIDYEAPVYRPPSEWRSLLIQVTIGCSNNKCTYCDMYRSKSYREREFTEILNDIEACKNKGLNPEKVFLCDGDALGAPQELLINTLRAIRASYPSVKRVGIYATAENILNKTNEQLLQLQKEGLGIAYLGLESGDDLVLHMIVKGNTAQEMKEASLKIKSAGIQLSTIAMLGVGGRKYSAQHITETAKMLSATSPQYFSFLTTFSVPGTPYHRMLERGLIEPLTSFELIFEMREILRLSTFESNPVLFRANHVSNALPIGGTLPADKEQILNQLELWLESTPRDQYPTAPRNM